LDGVRLWVDMGVACFAAGLSCSDTVSMRRKNTVPTTNGELVVYLFQRGQSTRI
jgi:hypothetical protein